jgi:Mg-chelatase subunit ChlD
LEKGAMLNPDLLAFITDGRPTAGEFSPEIISQKLKMTEFKGKFLVVGIDVAEDSIEVELLKVLASSSNGELRVIGSGI